MNSDSDKDKLVYVRNNATNLTYYGYVKAFSESYDKREIVLQDVTVYYSDTFKKLYSLDVVYLEFNGTDFSIETPTFESNNNQVLNNKNEDSNEPKSQKRQWWKRRKRPDL